MTKESKFKAPTPEQAPIMNTPVKIQVSAPSTSNSLWDMQSPVSAGAKRISQIPIVATREMPVGASVSGKIMDIGPGRDETVKTELMLIEKSDGTQFKFPISTVIETALNTEFKDYHEAIGHYIWITKTGEKSSRRHHERNYNVFEIYVKRAE